MVGQCRIARARVRASGMPMYPAAVRPAVATARIQKIAERTALIGRLMRIDGPLHVIITIRRMLTRFAQDP